MYQQLWGYKVEDKLYLGVREQKGLNTAGIRDRPLLAENCKLFNVHKDKREWKVYG
jgi:hypothetical protein